MVSAHVIAAAQRGIEGERLLPEETVAGRPALVIERAKAAGREVTWVDKEYGFPLAGRAESEGKLHAEFRTQDIRINQGIDPAVSAIEAPAGMVTLRGSFGLEDAEMIRYALSESRSAREGRIPFVGFGDSALALRYVLTLPRVPLDFRGLGYSSMSGTDGWAATREYVSPTGATIAFTQRADVARVSLLEVTGGLTSQAEATPVKVDGRQATLYRHKNPYPGAILIWEQQGVRAILEATQITQEQLVAMAASVMPLKVTPEKELLLPDLATAASLLAMPVYRPSYLPQGAKLLRLTVVDKGGMKPLHLIARYRLPRGLSLTIRQRQVSDFPEADEPPGGQSASVPGGEAVYYPSPSLTWKPKESGSIVIISGRLSKADMLKIARSLRVVAPPR